MVVFALLWLGATAFDVGGQVLIALAMLSAIVFATFILAVYEKRGGPIPGLKQPRTVRGKKGS